MTRVVVPSEFFLIWQTFFSNMAILHVPLTGVTQPSPEIRRSRLFLANTDSPPGRPAAVPLMTQAILRDSSSNFPVTGVETTFLSAHRNTMGG
eukprot:CAMPEP_0116868488 /NCGR_PEP_ID=MMETSP0418-20121206/27220_1 /TAXON_ID=1158023 /ORGANISM="Astrosyne radiata, Strain 13vi08-1A" /LENGTH=92 /DNA_ID=CAMNT_0004504455 /DNA_START=43 /DNA_END=318 /DNA_ORIENTATION=-